MELTVAEASKELGMTPQGVREAIHLGRLPARKVTREGGSPLRPIFLLEAADVARYKGDHRREGGGWNRGYDPEETARMEGEGYLTVTEAAREIGVLSHHLTKQVKAGKIAGVRKHITFIHRDEVARLKRERERKIREALA